ncbi:MAG: hypothetical protein ACPG77_17210 [Nannocystaceae bacterium]
MEAASELGGSSWESSKQAAELTVVADRGLPPGSRRPASWSSVRGSVQAAVEAAAEFTVPRGAGEKSAC